MNFGKWIGLIALVISLYILWQIRELLLLLFTAVVLATVINRLVRWLRRWRLRRPLAVLVSISLIVAFIVGCYWLIVVPLAGEFKQLAVLLPKGFERLNSAVNHFKGSFQAQLPVQMVEFLPDVKTLKEQLQPLFNDLAGRSVLLAYNSVVVVLHILLVVVLTLMLLFDPQSYRQAFMRLFPSFYRRRVEGILNQCEVALGGWTIGVLFNMIMIGLFSCIGLWILGVKLALAQGVLAGLLMFIPNIGPTVSVIPPMAIALLDKSYGAWKSFGVLALFVASHVLESHVLTPFVMAKQVSLLPAGVLLSQLFFATVFGFLGLFMAIPLAVVAQIWLQEVLIKDVLDHWHRHPKKETELVVVAEYSEGIETVEVTKSQLKGNKLGGRSQESGVRSRESE